MTPESHSSGGGARRPLLDKGSVIMFPRRWILTRYNKQQRRHCCLVNTLPWQRVHEHTATADTKERNSSRRRFLSQPPSRDKRRRVEKPSVRSENRSSRERLRSSKCSKCERDRIRDYRLFKFHRVTRQADAEDFVLCLIVKVIWECYNWLYLWLVNIQQIGSPIQTASASN
jgi:hypothetical protein